MAHKFTGDIEVLRTGTFARRVDRGRVTPAALAAAHAILRHDQWWKRLATNNAGEQDVTLPDATTLPADMAWEVVVHNIGGTDALNVKDGGAGALIKKVNIGVACRFVCQDNGTAAGVWFNYCFNEETEKASRFIRNYVVADFSAESGGYRTLTTLQSAHLKGATPMVQIYEKVATDHNLISMDRLQVNATGDIEQRVVGDPDTGKHDGRLIAI